MKKLCYGLLLSLACTAGCWPQFLVPPGTAEASKKAEKSARSARPSGLVTPDQVTEGNAHEIGKALAEELEKAENSEP